MALPARTGQALNVLFLFRQKERPGRKSGILVTAKDNPDVLEQLLGPSSSSGFHTTERYWLPAHVTYSAFQHRISPPPPSPRPKANGALKARINDSLKLHNYNEKFFYGGILKLVVFIGRFRKIAKSDSYLRRVCPSVRPHGTARLSLDEFLRNFIFENFSKICRKVQVSLKPDNNNGYFAWRPVYIYENISLYSS